MTTTTLTSLRALQVDGSASQPPIPNAVLGMAIFLATEAMFFAGLVSAYFIVRGGSANWPAPFAPPLPVLVTALNTAVLLASGILVHRAVERHLRSERRAVVLRDLVAAAVLGTLFLAVQGAEWVQLVAEGLTARSSRYGAIFYTLVGTHALHVVVALVALLFVTLGMNRSGASGREPAGRLRAMRMYWSFVVGLWIVLYVLLYLA